MVYHSQETSVYKGVNDIGAPYSMATKKTPKAKTTPKKKRNYRKEYDNYQGTAKQKKNRAKRNAARSVMAKKGKVSKGDGKDVIHKDGNPKNNKKKNLGVQAKSKNRSYARTKKAGKKNKKD